MKISVDNQDVFTLSETQKKVIKNDIPQEIFDEDMKRRLHYILSHKYERCFERLKKEWVSDLNHEGKCKLECNGVTAIPTDKDALAELIFSQPNYKCRSTRELEAKRGNV